MRKPFSLTIGLVLTLTIKLTYAAPVHKSIRAQLNPNYVRAMAAYKRLEPKLPRGELRAITAIGILNGAQQAEQQMEKQLVEVVKDLVLNTDMMDKDSLEPKITEIERQLTRDQRALQILSSTMDLAIGAKDAREFKEEMLQIRRRVDAEARPQQANQIKDDGDDLVNAENQDERFAGRVTALRLNIMKQVNTMKSAVVQKIEDTLEQLIEEADDDGLLAKASNKVVRKRDASNFHEREEPAQIRMIKSILTESDFRSNLIDNGFEKRKDVVDSLEDDELRLDLVGDSNQVIANRSSNSTSASNLTKTITTTAKPAKRTKTTTTIATSAKQQLEGSPEILTENGEPPVEPNGEPNGGGGGLVGIITSLSGGEGGSDIGALIGALTGLISTLFGPGGLDIESLIGTATSLISGLLAGNKNFGTVLGQYVGTAFDGLSGGGGAINNGLFIGNFLGTVVASLSADPEEDDVPPKPLLFAQNLLSSFLEAKNRKGSDEVSGERNGGGKPDAGGGGSDSAGFIKHIVSHLVGSVVSLILNASIGASGGASHASSALFAGSSGGGHKPAAGGIKSW